MPQKPAAASTGTTPTSPTRQAQLRSGSQKFAPRQLAESSVPSSRTAPARAGRGTPAAGRCAMPFCAARPSRARRSAVPLALPATSGRGSPGPGSPRGWEAELGQELGGGVAPPLRNKGGNTPSSTYRIKGSDQVAAASGKAGAARRPTASKCELNVGRAKRLALVADGA